MILKGKSYRVGESVQSYANPKGFQFLLRKTENRAMVVVHTFERICEESLEVFFPQLMGFEAEDYFGDPNLQIFINDGKLKISCMKDFDGMVLRLKYKE